VLVLREIVKNHIDSQGYTLAGRKARENLFTENAFARGVDLTSATTHFRLALSKEMFSSASYRREAALGFAY
jgi:hypothetical protein